jgi:hypothetical protein
MDTFPPRAATGGTESVDEYWNGSISTAGASHAKPRCSIQAATDLDASIALAVRFGPRPQRLRSTLKALDAQLKNGAFHYRYTGVDQEEGCFLAWTF